MILSLSRWYFFNHNTRHGIPTSITVSETITLTLAYPESISHTYVAFRDLVTVTFNMAVTVNVDCGRCNPINTLNGRWFCTFCTIKCEIPSITNTTAVRTYVSFVEHTKWGVIVLLVKNTILYNNGIGL